VDFLHLDTLRQGQTVILEKETMVRREVAEMEVVARTEVAARMEMEIRRRIVGLQQSCQELLV
jgi:hypothetical protein